MGLYSRDTVGVLQLSPASERVKLWFGIRKHSEEVSRKLVLSSVGLPCSCEAQSSSRISFKHHLQHFDVKPLMSEEEPENEMILSRPGILHRMKSVDFLTFVTFCGFELTWRRAPVRDRQGVSTQSCSLSGNTNLYDHECYFLVSLNHFFTKLLSHVHPFIIFSLSSRIIVTAPAASSAATSSTDFTNTIHATNASSHGKQPSSSCSSL